MEDSFNYYSNSRKGNYSDRQINRNNNKNSKYNNKLKSFDYENINNDNEINDFLGNSIIKYNFETDEKYLINDNNNENDNDISSEDEYESNLKYMKIGILTAKLNIFLKIIYFKIQKYYLYFISKIKLKIKSNEIFLQGDNFLYSKLKSKTSDVNKYYAFKKIIYIFRKNKYEKLIKESYFRKWMIIKNKYIFDNKEKINSIKIVKFCSILINILNKRLEKEYQRKYYISKWDILTKFNDIEKIKIKKGMLILSNLFNRKLRFVFKKFPRNYLNIKNKSNIFIKTYNNQQITYIIEDKNKDNYYQKGLRDFLDMKKKYKNLLKKNKLLKIIEKLEIKKRVNKNVYIFFNLLKNLTKGNQYKKKEIINLRTTLSDLKYDSMLNAATMIKIILNEHIRNDLFITKKYFLQKLFNYNRFIILFNKYKNNYTGIIEQINNEESKQQIQFIRTIYRKVFALQKILIINHKHKFFYSGLNMHLKHSLLQKYFYEWKNNVFNLSIDKYLKILAIQKIFLFLYDIYISKIKRMPFYLIKKRGIQELFNSKKYLYFGYYMYLYLKNHIIKYDLKYVFYLMKNFGKNNNNKMKEFGINIFFNTKKMYLIYKKYIYMKRYKYLIKWHLNSSFISQNKNKFQEKMKNILINLDNFNYNELLSKIFNKWKTTIYIYNKNYQLNQIKKQFFLNKFISTKTLMLKWIHFKKWLNTNMENTTILNYENLLIELDQLKKDNDELISIYYKKRQEYAKTLYDYNYMKKYYCVKCINENEDEIDYMSLKSSDIREAGKMGNSLLISQNKMDVSKDNSKNMKSKNYEEKNENDNTKNKVSYGLSSEGNNFIVNEENKLQSSNSNMLSLSEDEDINSHIGKKIPQCTGETIFSKNLFVDDNLSNNNNNNNIINTNNYKSRNKDNEDDENNSKENIIKEYQKEYEEQQKYYENYIKILLEKKNELIQMKNMLKKQKNENSKSD